MDDTRITIRIDKETKNKLKYISENNKCSLNKTINDILTAESNMLTILIDIGKYAKEWLGKNFNDVASSYLDKYNIYDFKEFYNIANKENNTTYDEIIDDEVYLVYKEYLDDIFKNKYSYFEEYFEEYYECFYDVRYPNYVIDIYTEYYNKHIGDLLDGEDIKEKSIEQLVFESIAGFNNWAYGEFCGLSWAEDEFLDYYNLETLEEYNSVCEEKGKKYEELYYEELEGYLDGCIRYVLEQYTHNEDMIEEYMDRIKYYDIIDEYGEDYHISWYTIDGCIDRIEYRLE